METHSLTPLDKFLPDWRLRQVDRIDVTTPADQAWAAARELDLYRLGFVKGLFWLRTVPDRLLGRGPKMPPQMTIDDIFRIPEPGFRLLEEQKGREVALGAIGKVWKLKIPFLEVPAWEWRRFHDPGFTKVAWSLSVDPLPGGGSTLKTDVRVTATDEVSWRKFRAYWSLIGPFSHAIRRVLLAHFKKALGERPAPDPESLALFGDDLIPRPKAQLTLSRLIEAPAYRVWPWLAQMGCRRGGWYSYDRLDNGGVPSALYVHPELQRIQVGDLFPATPKDTGGFAVLRMEMGRGLVLGSPELLPPELRKGAWGLPYRSTWQFDLVPHGRDACRLYVRVRGEFEPGLKMSLGGPIILLVHRFMESEQLKNLKSRCEAASLGVA
ncbi:MAG TPA: SRPBCC family protein [bacterium]|nr:SRPBCC family protein [bacterium]